MIKGHKRYTRGYIIFGAISVLVVLYLMFLSYSYINDNIVSNKAMPVRAVAIDGALKRLTKKELADITGRMVAGENITTLNLDELSSTIAQMPWVAKVIVKKRMPDTIEISVREHEPAAYFNDGLYDASTKTPFYPDMEHFNLPLVRLRATHDNLASDVYDRARVFMRQFKDSRYEIVEVSLDKARCYRVKLSNGIELVLGRDDGKTTLIDRIKVFKEAFLQTNIDVNAVEYIDLRYDSGFAIGFKKHRN